MIVWFRRDLRLEDNPAFSAATQYRNGTETLTAIFIIDRYLCEKSADFQLAILRSNLEALDRELRDIGAVLRLEIGDVQEILTRIAIETGSTAVFANADTTPYCERRDNAVAQELQAHGVDLVRFWGNYYHEPDKVLTKKQTLSKVFTPFYKTWKNTVQTPWPQHTKSTLSELKFATNPGSATPSDVLEDLRYDTETMAETVERFGAGPEAALKRLDTFIEIIDNYEIDRDIPEVAGTSHLSPDLALGTISARRIEAELHERYGPHHEPSQIYIRQLAWRDWYSHLLGKYRDMADHEVDRRYNKIEWIDDPVDIQRWKDGQTGYPIVDAAMRELKETGWMHNRLRMIAGSFLVKDLLVDWRIGQRWFQYQLVDFDDAQNAGNWQWVAGCGTDAAPYFRVFNPILQSKKFDPDGTYIRRWVPELENLSGKSIHEPAELGPLELAVADVTLGDTYPYPIVEHAMARDRAIAAYKEALNPNR